MSQKYYPALYLGEFEDGRAALQSVGVNGPLADFLLAGMDDHPGVPATYAAEIADLQQTVRTALVLSRAEDGRATLCLGYPDLLADNEEDAALMAASAVAEDVVAGSIPVPTFHIFELRAPMVTLQ